MSNKMDDKIKRVFVSSGEQKILEYLSSADGWKTAQEIKKAVQLSKAAVHLILNKLSVLGLLEKDQKGKTCLYRVNSDFSGFFALKQFKALNNLIDLYPLIKKLTKVAEKIILFGSASRGEDSKNSDIDLFIVAHDDVNEIADLIKKRKTDRKIQAVIRKPIDYLNLKKTDPVFYNEINSGIVIWEKES